MLALKTINSLAVMTLPFLAALSVSSAYDRKSPSYRVTESEGRLNKRYEGHPPEFLGWTLVMSNCCCYPGRADGIVPGE